MADGHRQAQRRQAPGVHPRLRRARPEHAGRRPQPPLHPRGHPGHRARPLPHRRLAGGPLGTRHVGRPARHPLYVTGRVTSTDGTPVPGAVLDVWQADADGAYEAQLPEVDEARLRAKYRARADGSFCIRTIAPHGYSIPMDGPVGDLIRHTDISHYRPAHFHVLLDEPGHRRLITHLFRAGAAYLDTDVVFGTKDALIVPFTPRPAGPSPDGATCQRPFLCAEFDFVLQPG
ncbi:hypothetical protein ACFQ0Q_37430 [Streptomyces aureus]